MKKLGDKIVCISKGSNSYLTIGKVYEIAIEDIYNNTIVITNDINCVHIYKYEHFDTLDNIRDKKLIEIGL